MYGFFFIILGGMQQKCKRLPIVERDEWLWPVEDEMNARRERYRERLLALAGKEGSLSDFANGYRWFGFQRDEALAGWWFREWLPGAFDVFLFGDFNGWQRTELRLERGSDGVWSTFLPDAMYADRLVHGSLYKIHVHGPNGWHDRIPAWTRRVVQNDETKDYTAQFWSPAPFDWGAAEKKWLAAEGRFLGDWNMADTSGAITSPVNEQNWGSSAKKCVFSEGTPLKKGGSGEKNDVFSGVPPQKRGGCAKKTPLLIYEAHVGMAQEEEKVGSYTEFAETVLPRIAAEGYNTLQLMAVAEHPYYGSFGYHVANFFAVSSRCGTPEELKALIRKAHGLGIAVVMDLVHAHYVKNMNEGLAELDGTDHQYSKPGPAGYQPHWDSMLFDYGRDEVTHFLLSNVKFWLDEFHFDGFRFDGVTMASPR